MRNLLLIITCIIKLSIASYNRLNISNESDFNNLKIYKGSIGTFDITIIRIPLKLTIQYLDDGKIKLWKSNPTEALREVNIYYYKTKRYAMYVYTIDYFSAPKQRFYLYKRDNWKIVSKDVFDSNLYNTSINAKVGSFTTYPTLLSFVIPILILIF